MSERLPKSFCRVWAFRFSPSGSSFRSFEDALAFYRLYNPDREISPQWVSERLTRTGRSDFPLYLPETRRMAILVFETKNIPPEESLK